MTVNMTYMSDIISCAFKPGLLRHSTTPCLKKWDKFKRLYLLHGLSDFYNILQSGTMGV